MADQEQSDSPDKTKYVKDADKRRAQILSRVLGEHDLYTAQRDKRVELLEKLEAQAPKGKETAYIAFICSAGASIDSDDIPAFGDVLLSIGEVDQLNLIIDSPGGDGTIAEKIIELCRAYCKEFKVIVPNRAKSAATIIALGADEILMGYCSELGPIDAQVWVVVGGVPRLISAQSFIDSRVALEKRYYSAARSRRDTKPILQQLAVLDAPFIDHCVKLMEFTREVARKYLGKYMFAKITPASAKKKAVDKALKRLSSVDVFKVHGRMIDGNAAKTELKLNVRLLSKDNPLWEALWEYYVRADMMLSKFGVSKVIESRTEVLVRGRTANE